MENAFRFLRIFMWTYLPGEDKNYPGFHLAADPESCLILIDWIEQQQKTQLGITRTIPLQSHRSRVASPISGQLGCYYFSKWRLSIGPDRNDSEPMKIEAREDSLIMNLDHSLVDSLVQGLRDVSLGNGDYCIHAQSSPRSQNQSLWFWPCFGEFWADD